MSVSYPVFKFHNTGKGTEIHGCGMSNGLNYLIKTIVGTGPVQDPHLEQAEEDQIIDMSLINLLKPLHPSDHIGPETISWLPNAMEGILGNVQSPSAFHQKE